MPAATGFSLPEVRTPRWQRVAENLTATMKSQWEEEIICLFALPADSISGIDKKRHYYVAEYYRSLRKSVDITQWIPLMTLSESSFAIRGDYFAVRKALDQHGAYANGTLTGHFGSCGWFSELSAWICKVIEPMELRLDGAFSQLNGGPSFNLIRFQTNGGAIWFKAVGEPNLREFSLAGKLAKLFPAYVPTVIAARPAWNGWLSLEAKGVNLGETADTAPWKRAASGLARLQLESTKVAHQILSMGAYDLRPEKLIHLVHPFLEAMGHLMSQQTKTPPVVLSQSELARLGTQIQDALDRFRELGVPDCLGHLDLNPGNIIVSETGCVFLDWAEAYVGPPFFSLEYLLEHHNRATKSNATLQSEVLKSYYIHWKQVLPAEAISEAQVLGPLLAVFAYACGSETWTEADRLRDPQIASYFRSLTRRMWREASQPREARAACS